MSGLEQHYKGIVRVVRLNVDQADAARAAQRYRIRGTPGFVLFDRHGRVTDTLAGWPGREYIARAFDQLLAQR